MADNSTIVACATGEGVWSARAILRLSGPACAAVERELLARLPGSRSPLTARLWMGGVLELPCLAWSAKGPATYTGEDTLELLVPGNPHLIRRVIEYVCRVEGVRPAEPGEFSSRAYHNGKLTLEQAEGIAAVIASECVSQLEAATKIMRGSTGAMFKSWAEECATLLALVEAGIDFTDQDDVVAIRPAALRERVEGLRRAIDAHLGSVTGSEAPSGRTRVALVGPPNAGKSTLFNALLGRVRAVATPIAGTTRDVLAEPLTLLAGHTPVEIELLDLPGLDMGATGIDELAQAAAIDALAGAAVVALCSDGKRFDDLPQRHAEARTVRVRTKADQPGWVEGADVAVCALTGAGLGELRRLLANAARGTAGRGDGGSGGGGGGGGGGGAVVPRHARALRAAADALGLVDADGRVELAAHHLRAALDALGEVSGAVPPDEIIGRVFASFCIGK